MKAGEFGLDGLTRCFERLQPLLQEVVERNRSLLDGFVQAVQPRLGSLLLPIH